MKKPKVLVAVTSAVTYSASSSNSSKSPDWPISRDRDAATNQRAARSLGFQHQSLQIVINIGINQHSAREILQHCLEWYRLVLRSHRSDVRLSITAYWNRRTDKRTNGSNMPRVVDDQRHKFLNDELFRKLSRESEVSINYENMSAQC